MIKKIFLFVAVLCFISSYGYAENMVPVRLISVSETATVDVVPDKVTMNFGLESSNEKLAEAKKDNSEKVQNIVGIAKEFKIDPKDIRTDYINVYPNYKQINYGQGGQQISGYTVSTNLTLELKDLTKFDALITTLLNRGATYFNGINFGSTQFDSYKQDAAKKAVHQAKDKAAVLAKEAGAELGAVMTIAVDQAIYQPQPVYPMMRAARGMAMEMAVADSSGGSAPSIIPGQMQVSATVNASFELK